MYELNTTSGVKGKLLATAVTGCLGLGVMACGGDLGESLDGAVMNEQAQAHDYALVLEPTKVIRDQYDAAYLGVLPLTDAVWVYVLSTRGKVVARYVQKSVDDVQWERTLSVPEEYKISQFINIDPESGKIDAAHPDSEEFVIDEVRSRVTNRDELVYLLNEVEAVVNEALKQGILMGHLRNAAYLDRWAGQESIYVRNQGPADPLDRSGTQWNRSNTSQ
jgi:hypothetical protein